ncbi:MAG TPA: sigma-70 family RNA polymerase sigma factor [Terracidiphilus sp.]
MSSEASYFPDALARTAEVCEAAQDVLDIMVASPRKAPRSVALGAAKLFENSDEQLLVQVRDGAKEPLGVLFRRYARSVRNVAYRILRDEAEAEDLVQEVFLFIFRKAALYDPARGSAATWIVHVAYHRAFDRRRYLNTRRFYASEELKDAGLSLEDRSKEVPFHARSIEGVLGKLGTAKFRSRLKPEQQETLQLFFFEGYALKEIAELTGRSLVNVRSHYYRGLERLRKCIFPETMQEK